MKLNQKKYILTLERFPQRDFIERVGWGFDQTEVVKNILDKFFSQNKTQKVKIKQCIEIIKS